MKNTLNNIYRILGSGFIAALVCVSCQKDSLPEEMLVLETETVTNEVQIKKENPFTTKNMRVVVSNLQKKGKIDKDLKVETTHLHVRFLPKDESEISFLKQNSDLEYFEVPLDLEYNSSYSHEDLVGAIQKNKQIGWQYTVVPVDYTFPKIDFEILSELYLPYKSGTNKNSGFAENLWETLEYEALRITNNLSEDEVGTKSKKWNPSGRITVEERTSLYTAGSIIPVRNCKVRVRRIFDWASTRTDANGDFFIGEKFKKKVNYSLEFETTNFKVTNALGLSINYNGPKQKGPWFKNFSFNNGSQNWVSATFINAITDFRTQAQLHNLKLPSGNTTIKVRPKLENGISNAFGVIRHYTPITNLLKRNDVVIYTKFSNGRQKLTGDLYEVMMHELGHVTHFLKSPINVARSLGIVNESWATAIEYYFTTPYYPNQVKNLPDQSRQQIIAGSDTSWQYTPFFIDLNDGTNQRTLHHGNVDYADDNVHGFTLHQMQQALDHEVDLDDIGIFMRNNFGNSSSWNGNMEKVIHFYDDIRKNHQ